MKKPLIQLAASTLALSTLLYGVAAHATSLAELPLKASVLAKPNVIFGMDDSGSMDWEILLDTDSGVFWWDDKSIWDDSSKKPVKKSSYVPGVYLFPVGTTEGGAIYPYNAYYGQAVPPTTQFAWLRSHTFNPLYFNPKVKYPAWAEANLGGASNRTFSDASPSSARSHPASTTSPTLNLTVDWASSNGNFTNQAGGYRFYVQAGMRLPAGTVVRASSTTSGACSGSTERTLTAEVTVGSGTACWASIPYFPATYWEPSTTCSAGPNCVAGPDGTTLLERKEIKRANYGSDAEYNAAIQNFANWFTYYRKRKLMLGASMGRALEGVSGMRMNVVPFNNRQTLTEMFDADSATNTKNRFAISGKFYLNAMAQAGTPTHRTMLHIGNEIDKNSVVVQYACQRNAMFVVTDGFANAAGDISVPSISSGRLSKFGGSSPYTTIYDESLAEIAMAYYANRLRTDLTAGQVPTVPVTAEKPNADQNPDIHANTYAISLGVKGSIWPTKFSPNGEEPGSVDPFTAAPSWPQPVADDPTMLDDLYHATINGRGQMYLADDVELLSKSIQSAFDDILAQVATQGGSSISSVNLDNTDGSSAFAGAYNPSGWTGDVTKSAVDRTNGAVSSTPDWSASDLLAKRTSPRKIVAGNGSDGGVVFDDNVSLVTSLVNPSGKFGKDADVMAYLRGDRSKEGTDFRRRNGLLGPVINSVPTYDRVTKMVYVESGEGMLHALNAETGEEEWAYVPYDAMTGWQSPYSGEYNGIGATVSKSYIYKTKLDATVAVGKSGASTRMLVGGMGAGGRAYFAIDVTNPKGITESTAKDSVRWTFPRENDTATRAQVGFTSGTPLIVKTVDGKYLALVTSGYDNGFSIGDGKGRMWALDASTGRPADSQVGPGGSGVFTTTDGSTGNEAGLAHITAFEESDGSVRYVYGGDLLGNLWRFDLKQGSPTPVLKVTQFVKDGKPQPVTTAPALVRYEGRRIIMVGTGRLLDVNDFGGSDVQSFYVISDSTDDTTITASNLRSRLIQRTYIRGGTPELSGANLDWNTKRGWYFDLPAGEKANTRPSVGFSTVAFATNKNGMNDCTASSIIYIVDITTGLQSPDVGYTSQTISSLANSTGATYVKLKDGSLRAVGDVYEDKKEGDPPPPKCTKEPCDCKRLGLHWVCPGEQGGLLAPSRNAWREVVR